MTKKIGQNLCSAFCPLLEVQDAELPHRWSVDPSGLLLNPSADLEGLISVAQ